MMKQSKHQQWNAKRNNINHDWLKNKIHTYLMGYIHNWGKKSAGSRFMSIWSQCAPQLVEIRTLIEQFPESMSPRVLFEESPLSRCDADTKSWLGEFVHQVWMRKYAVLTMQQEALDALDRVETLQNELAQAIELNNLKKENLERFSEACTVLISKISAFPHEVIVL